jgi:hexosaminidase
MALVRLVSFFLIFFIVGFLPAAAQTIDFKKQFKILPQPQKVEVLGGGGWPVNFLKSIKVSGNISQTVLPVYLKSLPNSDQPGKGVLTLQIQATPEIPASPEGYILEIKAEQATITARDPAGLFYGCQTLNQILEDARDQALPVPAVKITDFPELAYRAVHLDLKHHLDAGHYYYQLIDRLAQVKVNAIIVEFEDKLRYRQVPEVGASHAISIEEFAAISKYAQARHIQISPLVQGLGHASFILKHEKFKHLRDNPASDWSFDALHPGTYDLQFSLYEDAMAATPNGKYLHIGGDEVGNLGMSELAKKSGKKPFELQMYWLNKVCDFARQHNRIPIFWDDMVFKLSNLYETTYEESFSAAKTDSIWRKNEALLNQNISLFPKNCVYMRWNYDNPWLPGNNRAIDWYKKNNLNVMAATAAQTMWPMLPRQNSNFKPIKEFCRVASEKQMNGILCTVWDDCSPHFETVWRGLYNFAQFSWNYEDIPVAEANAIYRHRQYAPALADASFEFQNLLEEALVFWEKALLDKGYRNNYPDKIDLIELPGQAKNSKWRQHYKQKISGAQTEVNRYKTIKEKIAAAQKLARRNEYSLALMAQINELQIYPANLILLLARYDEAKPGKDKNNARQQVINLVNSFPEIRKNYETVFSQTRILNNPSDYILDQNGHHHLANGTRNSDYMYVFELEMNKKIKDWAGVK